MPGEGAQGGLLLGEIAFQLVAQRLQFVQVGFHVFGQHVLEPLTHALGQNRCLAVRADRQLQRTVGHDAPHVEIAPVGDVGHIQKVAHESPEALGPSDFVRFDGGDDADIVAPHVPRPGSPTANGPHVLVLVDEGLNRFRERIGEDPHPCMRAALQQKVQFFLGDLRSSEDVERETFGFQEDGELCIHGKRMERGFVSGLVRDSVGGSRLRR